MTYLISMASQVALIEENVGMYTTVDSLSLVHPSLLLTLCTPFSLSIAAAVFILEDSKLERAPS